MECSGTFTGEWFLGGGLFVWEEVLALGLVIAVVRGITRKALAIASALFFTAAFPPWGWQTWLCCFTPLLVLWAGKDQRSWGRDLAEAVAIGLAMVWLTTSSSEEALPSRAWLARMCIGTLFGLQLALLSTAMRRRINEHEYETI